MRYETNWDMVEQIREMAAQGMSSKEIAPIVGKSQKAVQKYFRRHNIPCLKRGGPTGKRNGSWNGGVIIDKDGYRLLKMPDHPNSNKHGYIREHRFVMSQHLGRPLTAQEVVHHIDGDKLNNAIENLELFAENRLHLKHELTGRRPNWTPEGWAKMCRPKKRVPTRVTVSSRYELESDVRQCRLFGDPA